MKLRDLIPNYKGADPALAGLTADSRAVKPGYLFAALSGSKADGANFVNDAIARGAVAILASEDVPVDPKVIRITARNPRRLFAEMAARFYGAQPGVQVAVTGTNGKTSVASFTRQIWEALGKPAASVGTLGVIARDYEEYTGLTTPDPVQLHRALATLKSRGIEHVALEASSHGLAQYRLDGLQIRAAAFTNLSRDHMDYHGNEEKYFFAKARLFGDVLKPGGVAVLNMEDVHAAELESLAWARGLRLIRVGHDNCEIELRERIARADGQDLVVAHEGVEHEIHLPLAGAFQAENALIAAALVIACGGDAAAVFAALSRLAPVPGRLELAGRLPNGASVYVDYAHTPDALRTVLKSLRPHVAGKLAVVFGCGGDRDRGKRPLMGEAAAEFADLVYVTDDNPRSEDPAAIRAEILSSGIRATEIADRRAAIERAVAALGEGDMLVVAGKGHETGQIVGDVVHPFSDREEVERAVARAARGELA